MIVMWLHTVAGPMIETFFSKAVLLSFLVKFSGIPSAMIAIDLNYIHVLGLKIKTDKKKGCVPVDIA